MPTQDIRRCPACLNEMAPIDVRGVIIDGCTHCDSFWFDAEELNAFAAPAVVDAVVEDAMKAGRRGRCKRCREALPATPSIGECFKCGHVVPRCPECACTPLVIGNFQGVNLDVCPRCHGIFFDAGELQLLLRGTGPAAYAAQDALNRARRARLEEARRFDGDDGWGEGDAARAKDGPHRTYACIKCQKVLEYEHAFVEGRDHYCGSCASPLASPLYVRQRHAGAFEQEMRRMERLNRAKKYSALGGRAGNLFALFSLASLIFGDDS